MFPQPLFGAKFENTKSFLFGGTDEYLDGGNNADFDFDGTDSFSVSAWIKTSFTGDSQSIISKNENTGNLQGWLFFTRNATSGKLAFLMSDSAGGRIIKDGNVEVDDGLWHHCVFTYNGSKSASGVKIYTDGTSGSSTSSDTLTGTVSNAFDFNIASRNAGADFFFTGNIDEVAIFNRVLTGTEVTELYNSGKPKNIKKSSFVSACISWYRMGDHPDDDGTGTTGQITDQITASANDLTPINTESGDLETDTP